MNENEQDLRKSNMLVDIHLLDISWNVLLIKKYVLPDTPPSVLCRWLFIKRQRLNLCPVSVGYTFLQLNYFMVTGFFEITPLATSWKKCHAGRLRVNGNNLRGGNAARKTSAGNERCSHRSLCPTININASLTFLIRL